MSMDDVVGSVIQIRRLGDVPGNPPSLLVTIETTKSQTSVQFFEHDNVAGPKPELFTNLDGDRYSPFTGDLCAEQLSHRTIPVQPCFWLTVALVGDGRNWSDTTML